MENVCLYFCVSVEANSFDLHWSFRADSGVFQCGRGADRHHPSFGHIPVRDRRGLWGFAFRRQTDFMKRKWLSLAQ